MKIRKVPLRKCVVTNEMKQKKELIRVVRTPEGEVIIDFTGKKSGRGAYVSNNQQCFEIAKKKDVFSRHLNVKVSLDIYNQLIKDRSKGDTQ
jgi:predicted RNA-binding protein YlxR (DUF448 family)